MKRLAVIDLGSNTFHLLIVDFISGTKFDEIFRQRIFTGLGDGGIEKIKADSIQRGLDACKEFHHQLAFYKCDQVKITGTAALRAASNAEQFISSAETILGHKIEVIDGDLEADYIFKGVQILLPKDKVVNFLIMDIGGGSTEFIICNSEKILWAKSYKLGVGVLHASYHRSEPIHQNDDLNLRIHINETLSDLIDQINRLNPTILIGASGSFEVLESMSGKAISKDKLSAINISDFERISSQIVKSNLDERLNTEGLPMERVKLIVVAMILMQELVKSMKPNHVFVSPYALKEGLLNAMI